MVSRLLMVSTPCGRKGAEVKLPNLLKDMKSLVDPQSQTDPSFKSTFYSHSKTGN